MTTLAGGTTNRFVDEIDLANNLDTDEQEESDLWKSIVLVQGVSGRPLLTIGQIEDQAAERNEQAAKDKQASANQALARAQAKREPEEIEEDVEEPEPSSRQGKSLAKGAGKARAKGRVKGMSRMAAAVAVRGALIAC